MKVKLISPCQAIPEANNINLSNMIDIIKTLCVGQVHYQILLRPFISPSIVEKCLKP